MDSVRFGRVLGTGARLAGRTLVAAVDAATAPNPTTPEPPTEETRRPTPDGVVMPKGRETGVRTGQQLRDKGQGVQRGSRQFGRSVWRPFVRASGVLWLEVTGVFFGLVALFGLQGVWSYRGAAFGPGAAVVGAHRHFVLSLALAVVFGYFCVSSFVRASRRGRRP